MKIRILIHIIVILFVQFVWWFGFWLAGHDFQRGKEILEPFVMSIFTSILCSILVLLFPWDDVKFSDVDKRLK